MISRTRRFPCFITFFLFFNIYIVHIQLSVSSLVTPVCCVQCVCSFIIATAQRCHFNAVKKETYFE